MKIYRRKRYAALRRICKELMKEFKEAALIGVWMMIMFALFMLYMVHGGL